MSLNQLLVDQPRPEIAGSTLSLDAWISAAPHQVGRTQAGITVRSAGTKASITELPPTAIPGRGQPGDAVLIARASGATATTALANGHRPDGLG